MINIFEIIKEFTLDFRAISANLIIALVLIIIGIFIGKFVKLILGKVFNRLRLEKIFKYGTVDISLTIVKWSIYLFFIGVAIEKLNIPYLGAPLYNTISIIPKSIGSLIIIIAGFFLGSFFKDSIIQANKEWKILGNISFYFLLYLSFIISIQLVFTFSSFLVNWVSVLFTGFYLLFLTLRYKK